MRRICFILTITLTAHALTGCTLLDSSRKNNVMGNLTTTVFDNRNSFKDLEINKNIQNEVKVESGNTAKKDKDFWDKIKIHFSNMKWR